MREGQVQATGSKHNFLFNILAPNYEAEFANIAKQRPPLILHADKSDLRWSNVDVDCSICLDYIGEGWNIKTQCAHHFHVHCIARWIDTNPSKTCPCCRQSL
jgi:hypothetical protein